LDHPKAVDLSDIKVKLANRTKLTERNSVNGIHASDAYSVFIRPLQYSIYGRDSIKPSTQAH